MLLPRILPTRRSDAPSDRPSGGRRDQRSTPGETFRPNRQARTLRIEARPVVDLAQGAVAGADVFVHDPPIRLGPHRPDDMLVTARFTLNEITDRAELFDVSGALVHAALGSVAATGTPSSFVAIALHARFIADDSFLDTVKEAVRRADVDPHRLLLSVVSEPELDLVWSSLQRLRSHGVRVAIEADGPSDDCVELLHRLPVDVVRFPAAAAFTAIEPGLTEASPALQRLIALDRCRVWVSDVRTADELHALRSADCSLVSGAAVGTEGVV